MCCEDLRIAESQWADGQLINLVAGNNELLPASSTRVAIVVGQQASGTVRLAIGNDDPSAGGLILSSALPPIMLDIWKHGNAVRKAIRVNASAPTTLYVIETHLSPANPCNGSG